MNQQSHRTIILASIDGRTEVYHHSLDDDARFFEVALKYDSEDKWRIGVRRSMDGLRDSAVDAIAAANLILTIECTVAESLQTFFFPSDPSQIAKCLPEISRALKHSDDGEYSWTDLGWVNIYDRVKA